MAEAELKCEKPKEKDIKSAQKERVEKFAKTLLKVLGKYRTQQEKDYLKFLGVKGQERLNVSVDYPLYQQSQACYAVNKLIEETGKIIRITAYSDGERSSPDFQDIEVKRDKYESLLVFGKIFFKWKEMKCIASLFFRGQYAESNFIFNKKYKRTMKRFQAALRRYMYKHNYFKGEKLEFMPYSRLRFLKYPKMSWEDLILKEELREEIELNLLFPLANEKLCKEHNLPWRRGVLLAGVPGTGKTQLGRVLCNSLEGITVIWATTKAVHDSGKVKDLFEIARNFAPSLIIMEDIDFFGQDREFITNPTVGELLNQLDGSAPNDGVFVLATTNRPHLLDKALADRPSRFDIKLHFEPPQYEERLKMVKLFGRGKTLEVSDKHIAEVTAKLTGSHIKEVINYATLLALKEGFDRVKKRHIEKALRKIREKLSKQKSLMVS